MHAHCPPSAVSMPLPLVRFLNGLAWGQPAGCRNLAWVPVFSAVDRGCRDPRGFTEDGGSRWPRAMRAGAGTAAAGHCVGRDPAAFERLLEGLPATPGQVGFIALVDGVVAGGEVLGHPGDFARLHGMLLRRYARIAGESADSGAARLEGLRDQDLRLARLAVSFRQRADQVARAYQAAVGVVGASADGGRRLHDELRTLEAGVELFARQRRILLEELELLADDPMAGSVDDARDPAVWAARARAFLARTIEGVAGGRSGSGGICACRISASGLHGTVWLDGDEVIGLSLGAKRPARLSRTRH